MIKSLYKLLPNKFSTYKELFLEAEKAEDADLLILVDNLPEVAPICTKEQELREYIRTAKIDRKITHLFVHCTATQPTATVSAIVNYWKKTLGWKNSGYHIILPTDGFTVLADFNTVCNGVAGFNSIGVHISYVGGIDSTGKPKDTRTKMQARLIEVFIEEMLKRFPHLKILGHNEVPSSNKACPSFSVNKEYSKYWTGK